MSLVLQDQLLPVQTQSSEQLELFKQLIDDYSPSSEDVSWLDDGNSFMEEATSQDDSDGRAPRQMFQDLQLGLQAQLQHQLYIDQRAEHERRVQLQQLQVAQYPQLQQLQYIQAFPPPPPPPPTETRVAPTQLLPAMLSIQPQTPPVPPVPPPVPTVYTQKPVFTPSNYDTKTALPQQIFQQQPVIAHKNIPYNIQEHQLIQRQLLHQQLLQHQMQQQLLAKFALASAASKSSSLKSTQHTIIESQHQQELLLGDDVQSPQMILQNDPSNLVAQFNTSVTPETMVSMGASNHPRPIMARSCTFDPSSPSTPFPLPSQMPCPNSPSIISNADKEAKIARYRQKREKRNWARKIDQQRSMNAQQKMRDANGQFLSSKILKSQVTDLRAKLVASQSESQHLKELLVSTERELLLLKQQVASSESEKLSQLAENKQPRQDSATPLRTKQK